MQTPEVPATAGKQPLAREPFGRSRRARLLYQPLDPKTTPRLDRSMRSDEALQVLGRHQLGKLLGAQSGVVHDLHPEHLHDFRVALRRTRTLLGQMRDVVLSEPCEHFRAEFRWLAGATSSTRDLDVLLEQLPGYHSWVSNELDGALEVLEGQFASLRNSAHQGVVSTLDSQRYRHLVREWQSFLASPLSYTPLTRDAGRDIRWTARRLMGRQAKRVFRLARAVTKKSSETELHRLRIEAKKLRYLFEFFGDLFPKTSIDRRILRLKKLQDRLGAIHDYSVHRDLLLRLSKDPICARSPEALVAIGEISRSLKLQLQSDVGAFASEAKRFARPRNRRRFGRLR